MSSNGAENMGKATLSTADKEAILKMAGVLIMKSGDRHIWVARSPETIIAVSLSDRDWCIEKSFRIVVEHRE